MLNELKIYLTEDREFIVHDENTNRVLTSTSEFYKAGGTYLTVEDKGERRPADQQLGRPVRIGDKVQMFPVVPRARDECGYHHIGSVVREIRTISRDEFKGLVALYEREEAAYETRIQEICKPIDEAVGKLTRELDEATERITRELAEAAIKRQEKISRLQPPPNLEALLLPRFQ